MSVHAHATASSRAALTVLAVAMLSCSSSPSEPPEFVGMSRWTRFDRGANPVHVDDPSGHATVYIDRLPPHGATTFPIGTHAMRVMGEGSDPTRWLAHGMVRVGGDFNAGGAIGWEFFGLALSADAHGELVSRTLWRGVGPPDGATGYAQPDGGPVLGCNHCHGVATWNDSVLGDELILSRF